MAISPQFNILETDHLSSFKLKMTFMRASGASGNNIFSLSMFKFHHLRTLTLKFSSSIWSIRQNCQLDNLPWIQQVFLFMCLFT
jgi:hypothetical protein